MAYQVVFETEHEDDTALVEADPRNAGLLKAMMDYACSWPLTDPQRYVLGGMRGEVLEWLNTNPALRGDNRLGFYQQRTGLHSFTRRLYVEFDDPKDAMLFRLTWGGTAT